MRLIMSHFRFTPMRIGARMKFGVVARDHATLERRGKREKGKRNKERTMCKLCEGGIPQDHDASLSASRRDFLKASTATAAAAGLSLFGAPAAAANNSNQGGNQGGNNQGGNQGGNGQGDQGPPGGTGQPGR